MVSWGPSFLGGTLRRMAPLSSQWSGRCGGTCHCKGRVGETVVRVSLGPLGTTRTLTLALQRGVVRLRYVLDRRQQVSGWKTLVGGSRARVRTMVEKVPT